MYAQLRVYTINRGMMDAWVYWFNEELLPIAHRSGHVILGPWVNENRTEFVWIRTYNDADDARAKDERFYGSAEWKRIGGDAARFIAKTEVKIMSSAEPDRRL